MGQRTGISIMEIYFKNLTPEEGVAEELLRDLSALGENTEEFFRASEGKLAEKSKQDFLNGLQRVKASCRNLQKQSSWLNKPAVSLSVASMGIAFGLGMLTTVILWPRPRQKHKENGC
jgi:hypothetical protein